MNGLYSVSSVDGVTGYAWGPRVYGRRPDQSSRVDDDWVTDPANPKHSDSLPLPDGHIKCRYHLHRIAVTYLLLPLRILVISCSSHHPPTIFCRQLRPV